jgi:hypothetical protein
MGFLTPIAGYALRDNTHSDTSWGQPGVADTLESTRDIEGSGEPTWEGWRVTDCLTERYSTDAGEDETLGDLKEGGRVGGETGTGSSALYRDITEEGEEETL